MHYKTWKVLNVYISNKLQFERKLGWQPGKPIWELLVWDLSSFEWNKKSHWLCVSVSTLSRDFDLLDHICPKRVLLVENRKSEHHHWILHIWISLNTKFQVKLTVLIFWTKFGLKGYFQSKMEEVNITTEFWIFELV